MKQHADALLEILNSFVEAYEKLVTIGQEKTQILMAGDVKKLEQLLQQEAEVIIETGKLEKSRVKFIEDWAAAQQWTVQDLTLEFILEQVGPPGNKTIETGVERLKALLEQLRETNELNGGMIDSALHFVNYSLELITGGLGGDLTYGSDGHVGEKEKTKLFDQKA